MVGTVGWASGVRGTPFRLAGVEEGRGGRLELGERRAMVRLLSKFPRSVRAEVARANPPQSGALCLVCRDVAKNCWSSAALIRQTAPTAAQRLT